MLLQKRRVARISLGQISETGPEYRYGDGEAQPHTHNMAKHTVTNKLTATDITINTHTAININTAINMNTATTKKYIYELVE